MSSATNPILYLALRSLLAIGLQKSLGIAIHSATIASLNSRQMHFDSVISRSEPQSNQVFLLHEYIYRKHLDLSILDIPINRIKTEAQLEYVSALTFKLAQLLDVPAVQLAQSVVLAWQATQGGDAIWSQVTLTAKPTGWLHVQLSDPAIARWLQRLASDALLLIQPDRVFNGNCKFDLNASPVFAIMHSHARCWTLCAIAASENLMPLTHTAHQFRLTHELPWLDSQQLLRSRQPLTWQLIVQISDAIDYLAQSAQSPAQVAPPTTLKVADRLSRAFDAFDAGCRIWGNRSIDRSLTQVHCGLVLITQQLLQILLEQHLGLAAPQEL